MLATFVGNFLGNIPVKFDLNRTNGLGGVVKDFFPFLALAAILFIGAEQF